MTLSKDNRSNLPKDLHPQPVHNHKPSETKESYKIPLLEEKIKINRRKQKTGEVIVRKEIETKIVQIPISREKLIVERIGKQPEQLAEIIINEEKVNGFEFGQINANNHLHITKSHFLTVKTAQQLLEALAHLSTSDNARIRLEIVTNCSKEQIKHQSICEKYQ
jgi:stress response protein YsnF